MKNAMISMSEIQSLIDKQFGYAQDPDMIKIMQEKNLSENDLHLVQRRVILRLFAQYAKKQKRQDYHDVLRNNDKGTKGAKYDRTDIEKMISDPDIKEIIEKRLEEKTKSSPFGIIPICIYHEYIEEQVGGFTPSYTEEEIINLTGYTSRQLELFNMPIFVLEARLDEIKSDIEELQAEKEDILNELKTRGCS